MSSAFDAYPLAVELQTGAVRLTQLSHGAGCARKLGQGELESLLEGATAHNDPASGSSQPAYESLISHGEKIRPWLEEPISFSNFEWRVMEPARLAVLDRRVGARLCTRPELSAALLDRLIMRTRSLAIHAATENMRGLADRLLTLFWHLAAWAHSPSEGRWSRSGGEWVLHGLPPALGAD